MNRLPLFVIILVIVPLIGCQWLPEVAEIRLNEISLTLKVGGTRQLIATVEPAAAEYEGITWTSSDPSVATVTNGTILARKVGTAQITASAAGVSSSPCQVTVDATHVTGISLSTYSVEITEGESITLKATVSPSDATDPSFNWGSDNTSVASVQNGKIVAISPGTANISVKTTDGNKTATCKVTVKSKGIEVTGITLSQSSISIKEEEILQLKATVKPSNATDKNVKWSSGDEGVATVSSDGTVTGVTEGTTTITATSADGKISSTCKVTVTAEYIDIPDPNFREYILDNFDLNGNGEISLTEASAITRIDVNTDDIESLMGIEFMSSLAVLRCRGSLSSSGYIGKLYYLNVGQNTSLTELNCMGNQLTTLDVSRNKALTELSCSYNQLTELDVSRNTVLTRLFCYCNPLSALDVSKNTALQYLDCIQTKLSSLDVSRNTALLYLACNANQLTTLDVSKNTLLTYLHCADNQLTTLDVSRNTTLQLLSCQYNGLTTLDVSRNTTLQDLSCQGNGLTTLDVSRNTALQHLICNSNRLTSLDVSKNPELYYLICSPMSTLKTLYVALGQSINGVTVNRDTDKIPANTSIVTK